MGEFVLIALSWSNTISDRSIGISQVKLAEDYISNIKLKLEHLSSVLLQ